MKISVASDLHLEFTALRCGRNRKNITDQKILNWDNEDNADILLLAGDIIVPVGGFYDTGIAKHFFENVTNKWERVFYIPGNHEFYDGVFPTFCRQLEDYVKGFGVEYAEVKNIPLTSEYNLVAGSLWTDMDKLNPVVMSNAQWSMNDYNLIKYKDGAPLTPQDTVSYHNVSKMFLFESVRVNKEDGKRSIVMTHHAPTYESTPKQFRGDVLCGAYCSDLSSEILNAQPWIPLWVHGHIHDQRDYMVDQTQVVMHTRGYDGTEFTVDDFSPRTIVLD